MTKKEDRFAVVGGGISGLYAAWRLARSGHRVLLLEAQDRIGGRILSTSIPGTDIVAELGAMRFTERHSLLTTCIKEMGLEDVKFGFEKTWFYYLRGQRFADADLQSGYCRQGNAPIPYKVHGEASRTNSKNDGARTPLQLMISAIVSTLKDLDFNEELSDSDQTRLKRQSLELVTSNPKWETFTEVDWRLIKKYGEIKMSLADNEYKVRLRDTGFWNLLEHYLGNEGFQLVHDGLGYESIVGNWNSAEAIPWFVGEFSGQQEYRTIPGGFGRLVESLEHELTKLGVSIEKNRLVLGIQKLGTEPGSPWMVKYKDESSGFGGDLVADHVILALPRKPLERLRIEGETGEYDAWVNVREQYLPAVVPHRLFKVLLLFRKAWWQDLAEQEGGIGQRESCRVITDLPIRQVYYYTPKWIKAHALAPEDDGSNEDWAMVMASYSDSHYVSYWQPFVAKPGESHNGFLNRNESADLPSEVIEDLSNLAESLGVPPRMILKLRGLLADLHNVPVEEIPIPIIGIYADWGKDPNERGGWHSWEVGYDSSDVAKILAMPLKGERVYTCGEAYSCEQGWVEGALQSAERVLKLLDIAPDLRCQRL